MGEKVTALHVSNLRFISKISLPSGTMHDDAGRSVGDGLEVRVVDEEGGEVNEVEGETHEGGGEGRAEGRTRGVKGRERWTRARRSRSSIAVWPIVRPQEL